MRARKPPLGTVQYMVHYQKPTGWQSVLAMEVENNSMATTNLVYDFYKQFPGCKIIGYRKT